jgi:hypothetical protein
MRCVDLQIIQSLNANTIKTGIDCIEALNIGANNNKANETVQQKQAVTKKMATETKREISVADELTKLKKLKDEGVLTEEEFNVQKKKLLSR